MLDARQGTAGGTAVPALRPLRPRGARETAAVGGAVSWFPVIMAGWVCNEWCLFTPSSACRVFRHIANALCSETSFEYINLLVICSCTGPQHPALHSQGLEGEGFTSMKVH